MHPRPSPAIHSTVRGPPSRGCSRTPHTTNSANTRQTLASSRAQLEALDRDIAPMLQRQQLWLMSSSNAGPLRISDDVVANHHHVQQPLASLRQFASTPLAPPAQPDVVGASAHASRPSTSEKFSPVQGGSSRPGTGRFQALRLHTPGSGNRRVPIAPSSTTSLHTPQLNKASFERSTPMSPSEAITPASPRQLRVASPVPQSPATCSPRRELPAVPVPQPPAAATQRDDGAHLQVTSLVSHGLTKHGEDGDDHPTRSSALVIPDPGAVNLTRELGLSIFTEGTNMRCVPPVYDRSNIATYWLAKVKSMDEFLSARIQLCSSEALRDKVATSIHTVELLLAELDEKKVTSREQRFQLSMADAVDKIIYQVSRRHLDAAERAKKDAEAAEEEERRLHDEEEARQKRILSFAQQTDVDGGADGGAASGEGEDTAGDAEKEDRAAMQRARSILFKNKRRQQQLRQRGGQSHGNSVDVDDDSGALPGSSASFQSNLQTILDTVETTESYKQLVEDEEDDPFNAMGDDFDGDGGAFSFAVRRPSAFETDPFALASERAARAGFSTQPGKHSDRSRPSSGAAPLRGIAPATIVASAGGGSAGAVQHNGGVSSFLEDRSRSFTAGGTCVLPGCITKSFYDVPVVGISRGPSSPTSVSARKPSAATALSAVPAPMLDPDAPSINDSCSDEDDDALESLRRPLQCSEDTLRLEEATCLARTSKNTLEALRQMEAQRTFPAYLRLQEHPELRPPPPGGSSCRRKEELDVGRVSPLPPQRKDLRSHSSAGGPGTDAHADDADAQMDLRIEHGAFDDANTRQPQQQRKKRALDLNNLAKFGEAAKAAAADGGGGAGFQGASSFTGGSGGGGGGAGGARSPRLAMEQHYGVKGILFDQGSIDGSNDALFGFYGTEPFEIPGIFASPSLDGSCGPTLTSSQRQRPVSPVSPLQKALPSPSAAAATKLRTFYKSVRYWVTNLSTTDVLALYITMDPKKTSQYSSEAVEALKAPNRPNAYVARVFPMSMLQVASFEHVAEEVVVGGENTEGSSPSSAPPTTIPPDPPRFHINTMVIKREKRAAASEHGDADTPSQQRSTMGTPEGSFAHELSQSMHSRRASRQAQAGQNSRGGPSENSPAVHQESDAEKQARAEKLRQAMILNQKRAAANQEQPSRAEGDGDAPPHVRQSSELSSTTRKQKAKKKGGTRSGDPSGMRRLSTDSTRTTNSDVSVVSTKTSGAGGGVGGVRRPSSTSAVSDEESLFVPRRKQKANVTPAAEATLEVAKPPSAINLESTPPNTVAQHPLEQDNDLPSKGKGQQGKANQLQKRRTGASGGRTAPQHQRRRTSSVTLVVETSPLFSAEGIDATVTTEDEFVPVREGEEAQDDDGGEYDPTAAALTSGLLSDGRRPTSAYQDNNDRVDESALYDALFAKEDEPVDGASHHGSDRGGSGSTIRSGLAVSIDMDADNNAPSLDGSTKASPVAAASGGRRGTESFQTLEALMARRGSAGSHDDENMPPAMRALLARKSRSTPVNGSTSPSEGLGSVESGACAFDDTSSSFHTEGDGVKNSASSMRPSATSKEDHELANVLSSVTPPSALQVLAVDGGGQPSPHKDSGGVSPATSVTRRGHKKTKQVSPPHSGRRSVSPQRQSIGRPPRSAEWSAVHRTVAARADRKNAILEEVLRSVAQSEPTDDDSSTQQDHHRIATPPLESSTSNTVEVPHRSPPAMGDSPTPSPESANAAPSRSINEDNHTPQTIDHSAVEQHSSSSAVPTTQPPSPLHSPVAEIESSHGKNTQEEVQLTDDESPTHPRKTLTDVIREGLEELAGKARLPITDDRDGRSSTSPLATADQLLSGTELEKMSMALDEEGPTRTSSIGTTLSPAQQPISMPSAASTPIHEGALHDPALPPSPSPSSQAAPGDDVDIPTAMSSATTTQQPGGACAIIMTNQVSPPAVLSSSLQETKRKIKDKLNNSASSAKHSEVAARVHPNADRSSRNDGIISSKRCHEHPQKADDDVHLRGLFDEDPDAFSEVLTDLADGAAARMRAQLTESPCHAEKDANEVPPSEQLRTYATVVIPPVENPELLKRERREAQRLLDEQHRLDALVAEIVGQVSRLWPTLQSAPSSHRAAFFQTSMEVAWRVQKKRALNVGKLITMLDRKVSTRGWYPRYDQRDELLDGSDSDSCASSSSDLLQMGMLDETVNDASLCSIRHQASSSLGAERSSSPRRRRSKRSTGGVATGKRRGSVTTLHKALSVISEQQRREGDAQRQLEKERQAMQLLEHGSPTTAGGVHSATSIYGSGVAAGSGSIRFRANRFSQQDENAARSDRSKGWEDGHVHPVALPQVLEAMPLHLPAGPKQAPASRHPPSKYQLVHVPSQPPLAASRPERASAFPQFQRTAHAQPIIPVVGAASLLNTLPEQFHPSDAPSLVPHQLVYGGQYPRHALDELEVPSASLAHARIQAIRRHRLTYHLALRTGLIRD